MNDALSQAWDLTGRTAVVTGAASGIGRATARFLAMAGANVIVADVTPGTLDDTAADCESFGTGVAACRVDVRLPGEVDSLARMAVDRFGSIAVWANVAGIARFGPASSMTLDDLQQVIAVNTHGVVLGSQAATRVMSQSGGGSIINVSSVAADKASPATAAYGMSKIAIAQFSRTLAIEVAPLHIRVNVVAPGLIATPMSQAFGDPSPQAMPIGFVGTPEDVAWSILFLAADASRLMTGQVLRPNGGMVMPLA